MSIVTEALLNSAGEAAPSARPLFHKSPLAGNFLHNVVVVVAVFASKAQCVVVDVEVAVPVCDSWQGASLLWHNKFFF